MRSLAKWLGLGTLAVVLGGAPGAASAAGWHGGGWHGGGGYAAPVAEHWKSWGDSCRRHEVLPGGGHGEALAPLRAPAREDLPALLGRHTDEEPVGPLPVPAVRLKCAYALGHDCLKPL